MLFFKKVGILTVILLITLFFIIIFLEIYASVNTSKFPSYSWQSNNIMKEKLNNCNKKSSKKKIGVFGDSAVEYHGNSSSNIVEQLSKKFNNHSLCNFGISGTGIRVYINRFLFSLDSGTKFDKVIFYIYEGNDFSSFRYYRDNDNYMVSENGLETGIFNYDSQSTNDRKLPHFTKLVKSTYAINIIYREIIKKYFFPVKINENFVKKIYNSNTYFEVPIENALTRMKNTPLKVKKRISADLVNSSMYQLALKNPNYYFEIHEPNFDDFSIQKKIAFHHIDFINFLCKKNKIDCKFIIVPSPNFLFKKSKKISENIYRFNYYPKYGSSRIVNSLALKYENFYYPKSVLEYNDYIQFDMHLTGQGNNKLANFTYEKFAD